MTVRQPRGGWGLLGAARARLLERPLEPRVPPTPARPGPARRGITIQHGAQRVLDVQSAADQPPLRCAPGAQPSPARRAPARALLALTLPEMLLLVLALSALAALPAPARAKVYERCELARELLNAHGVPRDQLAVWVCIARHESEFNTTAVGHVNGDGSGDHGLFQISDLYWCSHRGRGKACSMACSELLDDDISDDMQCAKRIHREHQGLSGNGFNAWAVYAQHCKRPERASKYLEGCFSGTGNELQQPHEAYGLPPPAITAPPPPHRFSRPTAAPVSARGPAPAPAPAYGLPPPSSPPPATRWYAPVSRRPAIVAPQAPAPVLTPRFSWRSAPSPPPRSAPAPPPRTNPQRVAADPRNFWNWQFLPTRRWF
ncbi:Lysozyme c-1 [Frankliniella fusca]|uniref:lysozyme n=1 Tax=Frankliniella fusca TaxID=407009 RepID=A0AAE1HGZ5_9NEOP|nr:Lysozyme c-1 [Frankliniella fusca]